jgi:hypothetical protein
MNFYGIKMRFLIAKILTQLRTSVASFTHFRVKADRSKLIALNFLLSAYLH